jgi:hypothetical protein
MKAFAFVAILAMILASANGDAPVPFALLLSLIVPV